MKCCLSEELVRDPVPRVFLGADHIGAPLCGHIPRFQTPRRKVGIQRKPHCLHRQFRHSEPLLSVVGALPKATFPDASQGPSLQSGLFKDSSQDCCVNTFLHSCEDGREAISKMETHGNSRAFKHSGTGQGETGAGVASRF